MFVPARVLGGSRAPSNRITRGFLGTGEHGRAVNLASMLTQPDAQIVALCDVDQKQLGLAAEQVAKSTGRSLESAALHGDWREVVARKDIDAVVISTPDHWHTPMAMAAIRA